MKRVLIILPNLNLGGTETVIMNFFRTINRDKMVFDFVVHGEKGFYEDEAVSLGARVFRAPTRGESFLGNISAMIKIYRGQYTQNFLPKAECTPLFNANYDTIIICTEHALAFVEVMVAWFCGVRTRAVWSHFSDYQGSSQLKRWANFFARPFLCLFANMFFACSKDAGRWLFGKYFAKNLHKQNFHIINNAIDFSHFYFSPKARKAIRAKYEISDKFAIGIVGRLTRVKNHAFALDIFEKFCKTEKNATLLVIGDGELRGELEECVARSDFSRQVIFTGKTDCPSDYYQALDLLIVPSLHEGLSLVTIEAQAASLHVLASDSLPPEVKISEYVLFKSLGDASAWAETIREIKNLGQKRAGIDLQNSGYHIKSEAIRFQEILSD